MNTFGADGLAARFTYGSAGDAGTGSESFYCFDPQGSVAEIVGSGGSVLGSFAIDAYGARTGTGATNEPYAGFGGQWGYYDDAASTGLILCGHRYYDAATGRWVTRDPIGYAGGMNLYGYCGDSPLGEVDASGLCGEDSGGGADDPTYLRNQLLLNGLGMVPGAGEFSNLASGLYAASHGDWLGAALAGAAMIPGAGEFADAANETRNAEKLAALAAEEGRAAQGATGLISDAQGAAGVYQFIERKTGKLYIGPSSDIAQRLAAHGDRVIPGTVSWHVMEGSSKLEREIAEQNAIDAAGGVVNLANLRNPIGIRRIAVMGAGYARL